MTTIRLSLLRMKKLSILIPVYNEASTIANVLKVVLELELIGNVKKEIIVIDDCSTDTSGDEIKRMFGPMRVPLFTLITHEVNKGKGGAIQTGIKSATGDYIIIQDADLELNPEEINDLIRVVLEEKANVVYGSRFLKENKKGGSFLSNTANTFLTKSSNLVFGTEITDMETCYKLVPADEFKALNLVEQRFGFEPEITAKLAKNKDLKWAEVPITYNPRTEEQGKKIGWKDGIRAIWCILKYGLSKKR